MIEATDLRTTTLHGTYANITPKATQVFCFENPSPPDSADRPTITQETLRGAFSVSGTLTTNSYAAGVDHAVQLLQGRIKDVLTQAGLSLNEKFSYEIVGCQPVVDGSNAVKTAFQLAFTRDPILMTDMAQVSRTVDNVARNRIGAQYQVEITAATVLGGTDDVWNKFHPIFAGLNRASGKVAYDGGRLDFSSSDYVARTLKI